MRAGARRAAALLGAAGLAGLGAWAASGPAGGGAASGLPVVEVRAGTGTVRAEVASTAAQRARGLMYRDHLPRDGGMLFVYPGERPLSFWMRNTLIPLDIAYVDAGRRVVGVDSMRPLTDDSHPSGAPAMYALETNRGWMAEHGVRVGTRVDFALPPDVVATGD